jgi:hypothetical protein
MGCLGREEETEIEPYSSDLTYTSFHQDNARRIFAFLHHRER